jgi:outer membrane protein
MANRPFSILGKRISLMLGGLLIALAILLPASSAFAQGPKIAYVNLQRALNEVDEGKTAKSRLKKDFEKKQKALNTKQEELQKLKEELESGGMMLSEEAKRQKVMSFQQKMYELQQEYMQMQGELAQSEAKETQKIFDKMGKIIEEIAKERKYDLVLESTESAILYAGEGMDFTDELIKRYNAKY